MNLIVGDDESEDEREEGNADPDAVEEVHNPEEANLFRVIFDIKKYLSLMFPHF